MIRFAKKTESLSRDTRILFYAHLTHELTVLVRSILSSEALSDEQKLTRIGSVNRLLHATSGQTATLVKNTAMSEKESEKDFDHWAQALSDHEEQIKGCVSRSLREVKRK